MVPGAGRVLGEGVFGIGREGWVDVVRRCEGRAWTIGVELVVAACWRCRARGPSSFERERGMYVGNVCVVTVCDARAGWWLFWDTPGHASVDVASFVVADFILGVVQVSVALREIAQWAGTLQDDECV